MTTVEASAPGKLILMGEHSAVYGYPAVVAAVGLRTVVRIQSAPRNLELDLMTLGHREISTWDEVLSFGQQRREIWERFREQPGPVRFKELRTKDPAAVVKIALAEAIRVVEPSPAKCGAEGVRVSVESDLPMGAGLGSSASVSVAVAAALLAYLGQEPTPELVARIAEQAEMRQHGKPSGVDHTTVVRGGYLVFKSRGGKLSATSLIDPDALRDRILVFNTGEPRETTGEVVSAVRAWQEEHTTRFPQVMAEMAAATQNFVEYLDGGGPDWTGLLASVRRFERGLETLGVVPRAVGEAVRRIEAHGGAAKISGAGALSGASAGSLMVFWPPEVAGNPVTLLPEYTRIVADLGVEGLTSRRVAN